MLKIRRALISVWDKRGIIDFAKKLKSLNIEIISTGKTASLLRRSKIDVKTVYSITSFPEILSGRVKTLHPRVFGAILANKKHPLHMEDLKNLGIEPIDMVVVNFYPFPKMVKEKVSFDQMLEYIDIGGPAMLRAAAKNFKNVACVSSPQQYRRIIEELEKNRGMLKEEALRELACEVFRITKDYDTAIYGFLKKREVLVWDLEKISHLRYGENPHQKGELFKLSTEEGVGFRQIQGKHLSFNNLLDLDTALSLVKDFNEPTVTIIKHTSPCGVAQDKKLFRAFLKAHQADPVSSFGGIVGLNRKVDGKTAKEVLKSDFKECIIAPSYSKEALRLFSSKRNLRIIEGNFVKSTKYKDIRRIVFGYLLQDPDEVTCEKNLLKVVTKKKPTDKEWKDLLFAWRVVKFVKSNAIVIAKNRITLGIGGGQPSRVGAVELAIKRAYKSPKGAVLASDGFFPKTDSIKLMKKCGIRSIIQPGGSIRDKEIIEICNKLNISMVFTGIRHFRH
ncbi:MAG: bifunctional phosphoribosylaminoimidazolecarboxamide formyltransferase/IMP cyclohydrolase [Candidatus Omnitrophica bacterium]|nr:bifunctional phosphoribosylaminoimidazolecarboxamide formyltransferase/IMP cyclohydrolase [Candidatus Omnitrophota bacterium]